MSGPGVRGDMGGHCVGDADSQFYKKKKLSRSVTQQYTQHYRTLHLDVVKIVNFMLCISAMIKINV